MKHWTKLFPLLQDFHFPLLVVLVHMIVKLILATIIKLILSCIYGRTKLNVGWKEYLTALIPTGLFSGIDIGFSNWGLELINITL